MMSRAPQFHRRQPFHLPLSSPDSSPLTDAQLSSQIGRQLNVPFGPSNYSPFRSAELKPPTPYGGPMGFSPRTSIWWFAKTFLRRAQYLLSKRHIWFAIVFVGLIWWWGNGGREDIEIVKVTSAGIKNGLFEPGFMKGLQFFPANNPKIHYVGRWVATPNRLRKDGTFGGVYFDIVIRNTTSLYLSLHNQPLEVIEAQTTAVGAPLPGPHPGHLSFRPASMSGISTPQVSLVAKIDQDEYVLLPNSSSMVTVRATDLEPEESHSVRIICPGVQENTNAVVELEGIWLDKGGKLDIVPWAGIDDEIENEDNFEPENDDIGESHRVGMNRFAGRHPGSPNAESEVELYGEEMPVPINKVIEIVTDDPGSAAKHSINHSATADNLLSGVTSWEYMIGEMFGVDHSIISVDGMCLIEDCVGGRGSPSSMSDVFFRSGPVSTPYYSHPWIFQSYIPSLLLLNLGSSDYLSFTTMSSHYPNDTTTWDLITRFEDAYVSLVKSIRSLAYPTHPAMLRAAASHFTTSEYAPSSIPIFIMRPLLGQLEHATQGAVKRLREDGDKAVYWLDTSGWLDLPNPSDPENPTPASNTKDFYLDNVTVPINPSDPHTQTQLQFKYRLTPRGNLRTSIFLHSHLCRFLADDETREKCAFYEPEDYVGKVFKASQGRFDRWVDDEKERKLKKLFWEDMH